ncbi:MAG: UDP-N-acetylglucosamine 2-epimerase (non-hydrolyzing) [candidate division WOR-3 bacterium]
MRKIVDLIIGARPNFIKVVKLNRILREDFNVRLIHTGQHYSREMSDIFFEDLSIPKPEYSLGVKSGTHAYQTSKIMIEYENLLLKKTPDLCVVFGDVNSTMAATLAAKKLYLKVAHVEAGLRSFDRSMPEEINRIVTDSLSDFLFAPSIDAVENLLNEGHQKQKIFHVGNIMIDTLIENMAKIKKIDVEKEFSVKRGEYIYCTLHRPSNVDNRKRFVKILEFMKRLSRTYRIVFPLHPRTQKMIESFGLKKYFTTNRIIVIKPVSYLKSIALEMNSKFVLTDSGGIQEETTYLKIPCFTLRQNTERPITVTEGTNMLIEPEINNVETILKCSEKVRGKKIKYWDGRTSERIKKILEEYL